MRLFKWTKALAVFIPEIDAEHQTIFRMADDLHQAVLTHAPVSRIQELLRALAAYTEDHMAHEEKIMRSLRYPAFAWHKNQHDTVRKRIAYFGPLIETGDPEAAEMLVEFLSQWLKDHLGLADRMMTAYVRNQRRLRAA